MEVGLQIILVSLGDCTGSDIGLFGYGVLYNPRFCKNLNKAAEDISEEDIMGHDVVIQLAGISNDPFGNLDPSADYIYTTIRSKNCNVAKIGCAIHFSTAVQCMV